MPTPILLLSPLVLGQLVASAHGCPAASAIDARVREILGIRQNALEERAVVGREGATLRVTLRDKDDRVLGDRWVHAEGSCDELAGVAAVVLAAWLSDVHPEYLGSLPAPAAPVSLPSTPERAAVEASAEQPSPRRWLLGAALGADLSAASPAPLAALGVRWIPTGSGWGAAIGATIIGARSEELSAGSVRYWRWPL
ncbi:MAG TPA: hypothetical protein VJT73_06660, partial [Polyangiaceae bacterium]|nr:hypothetical protein [Polyangiaceae bacterium]